MANRKECATTTAPTPGPWHTRASMSGVQIFNDAGVCVAKTPCFDRQAQADGALLAAAPELREQLTQTMAELARLHAQASSAIEAKRLWDTIERASFVVAKAGGRS